MTPRQVIAEILRDYRYNLREGMNTEQSLETLKAMLVETIEYEKHTSYERGMEVGRETILHELWLHGDAKRVLEQWTG